MLLKSVAAATPVETVSAMFADFVIPAEFKTVAMSVAEPVMPVIAVATTVPVVLASMVFKSVAVTVPADKVTPTLVASVMPVAVIAVTTCVAVPVIVFAAEATTLPVVMASIKLRSLAFTDKSVTVAAANDPGAPVV